MNKPWLNGPRFLSRKVWGYLRRWEIYWALHVCFNDGDWAYMVRCKRAKNQYAKGIGGLLHFMHSIAVVTVIAPMPAISLLGCALCGLSVSLMWPGMLSITAAGYPTGGIAMFAILALGGDLGCSIGPQFTGIVADRSSLHWGLLASIIFPAIMLVGLVVLKTDAKSRRSKEGGYI